MKARLTKGPLAATNNGMFVCDAAGVPIATFYGVRGNASVQLANAKLFAVAGELYEALDQFVRCSYPVSTEINELGRGWCEGWLDDALKNARAALAKAGGEAT